MCDLIKFDLFWKTALKSFLHLSYNAQFILDKDCTSLPADNLKKEWIKKNLGYCNDLTSHKVIFLRALYLLKTLTWYSYKFVNIGFWVVVKISDPVFDFLSLWSLTALIWSSLW